MKDPIFVKIYCVIYDDDKIIMTQDVDGLPGWKFPGGHVEEKELLVEASKREIKEEIGIEIEVTGILLIEDYFNEQRHDEHNINIYYLTQRIGGTLKLKEDEVAQVSKFNLAEIKKLKDYYPPHINAIKKLLNNPPLPNSLSLFIEK